MAIARVRFTHLQGPTVATPQRSRRAAIAYARQNAAQQYGPSYYSRKAITGRQTGIMDVLIGRSPTHRVLVTVIAITLAMSYVSMATPLDEPIKPLPLFTKED